MFVLNLFKKHRRIILALIDAISIIMAYFLGVFVVNQTVQIHFGFKSVLSQNLLFTFLSIVCMWMFGVYRNVWRYARIRDFAGCILGNVFSAGLCFLFYKLVNVEASELRILVACLLSICVVVISRVAYIYLCNALILYKRKSSSNRKRILIIGAGFAGSHMSGEFLRNPDRYEVVGFIDDDENKVGRKINGLPILGTSGEIPKIVEEFDVQTIALAIPSISAEEKKRIISICSETVCDLKILPGVGNLMMSKEGFMKQLAPIKIEDLLGREQVNFDNREIENLIGASVCMVTGGGGSIGSELSRQIARYKPEKLVIVDIYENNAYDIQQELIRKYKGKLDLCIEIASVRDEQKMELLFQKYRPQIVFHAAAHKHVPLMETNPEEAVKNNIFGTYNVANLACKYEAEKFVLVSTDKAVNPTNVMGATKRFCEMIVEYFAQQKCKTEYVAVRFGNVLGSNGSVIPLFERQIAMGGPVTVTHPDIVRYFMTIPEAASLILQAATLARGGEIFVLDMGEPVKILDLAKKMISLHGIRVGEDIDIEFSGLRPGEKLYEELLMDEEGLKKTSNHKIYIGQQITVDENAFLEYLSQLKEASEENDKEAVEEVLHKCVPTFIRKEQKSKV